jgi:putative ABC transport system permease protein
MLAELWSEIRFRLRALIGRGAMERELADELRFHIEREAEKLEQRGMSREAAVRAATIAFGGVDRFKEDSRDARGVRWIEHVSQDVKYALRGIRVRPGFTAVVVATLGLGVGVNAAMFGVIDRLMFRAPRYLIDPASVNRLYTVERNAQGDRPFDRSLEYPRYEDLTRLAHSISQAAAVAYRSMAVGDGDQTEPGVVAAVSATYFDFFTARPVLGRFFSASEDSLPAGSPVAVIGYGFWQSRYAGAADVLGKNIRLGTRLYTIIGVAPPDFEGVSDGRLPIAFTPLKAFAASVLADFYRDYGWGWLQVIVRRKPGVSVADATADLTNAYRRSWVAERVAGGQPARVDVARPEAIAGPLQLARGPMAGPETKVLTWIGGVALVVLLIACANVANLLLARGLRRRRELAVRRAIGGTRTRLVQQLLTEMSVMAVLGTVAGLAGAQIAAKSFQRMLVSTAGDWPVASDGRTLAFAVALTIVTAVLSGLLPAIDAGGGDLAGSLKAGTREDGYRHSRARASLLVVQTALSVVLLVGAGLFVRSLQAVRSLRLGYDVEQIAYVEGSMRGVKLPKEGQAALAADLENAARSLPGVEKATVIISVPFYSSEGHSLFVQGIDSVRRLGRFAMQAGSPDYFATVGTRILRGRAFTAEDRADAPRVAVVSEAMARVLWPNQDALGKCLRIGSDTLPCTSVIGVAENIRSRELSSAGDFTYYLPIAQYRTTFDPPMLAMFVRVRGRPGDVAETLRARLQRLMPPPSYLRVQPMQVIIDPTMQAWTSGAKMFFGFGALALALAAVGLYAIIAFAVAQRTREIGVRIALGAESRDVVRLVVGEGVRVTVAGVILGVALATAGAGRIGALLFQESAYDPIVYLTVVGTLLAVGILASAIPAARAARVDPNVALRDE